MRCRSDGHGTIDIGTKVPNISEGMYVCSCHMRRGIHSARSLLDNMVKAREQRQHLGETRHAPARPPDYGGTAQVPVFVGGGSWCSG